MQTYLINMQNYIEQMYQCIELIKESNIDLNPLSSNQYLQSEQIFIIIQQMQELTSQMQACNMKCNADFNHANS